MQLTAKQIEQIKKCASPEEVLEKVKELGLEMTLEEAQEALKASGIAELEGYDLEQVAGGTGGCSGNTSQYDGVPCTWCEPPSTNTVCKEVREGFIICHCLNCKEDVVRYASEKQ